MDLLFSMIQFEMKPSIKGLKRIKNNVPILFGKEREKESKRILLKLLLVTEMPSNKRKYQSFRTQPNLHQQAIVLFLSLTAERSLSVLEQFFRDLSSELSKNFK